MRFPIADIERLQKESSVPVRILVVDDDELTRTMVADTFASPPYQVFQAENAEEALAIAKRERLDLLLIDLKLPGRNGTEVIKELRETYSLRQMVVITAFPDLMQMEELLNHGAITVLRKPISVDQLLTCAEEIVGEKRR